MAVIQNKILYFNHLRDLFEVNVQLLSLSFPLNIRKNMESYKRYLFIRRFYAKR